MKRIIYADNAATTQLNIKAFEAMKPYLLEEFGNPSQPYSFSRATKKAINESRELIASCIGAVPDEVFFTSGGTESDNWAIKGIALQNVSKKTIYTSSIEHHAVLNTVDYLARLGHCVNYLSPDKNGIITLDSAKSVLCDNADLVSVMFANNEIGSIQPITELCEIAHSKGAVFHTDAVQAVGHVNIDVNALGVDMLSASAHKFNGPRGIGFLYIRKGTKIAPLMHGGAQEFGMRAGTENVAQIIGMAVALKDNIDNIAANQKHIKTLEKAFLDEINNSGISYVQNGTNTLPGLISLSFPGYDGEVILHRLDLMGICISTGSACDSVHSQVSHVLRAIQLDDSYAKGTIRISLGKDNTEEEIYMIANALKRVIMQ